MKPLRFGELKVGDALGTFFEANAERQVADGGLYATLAGRGRLEDKVRLWPEIVATVPSSSIGPTRRR